MPECPIKTNDSLDNVLINLNKFILKANKYARLQQDKSATDTYNSIKFKRWFETFKGYTKNKNDKETYFALMDAIQSNEYRQTTRGRLLFDQKRSIEPWYGNGEAHRPSFNQNLVVGVKYTLYDNSTVAYRVDFDDKKSLHINFDLIINYGKNYRELNYALIVSPVSDRYSVDIDNIDIEAYKELVQFKFFVKMTLDYLMQNPNQIIIKKIPSDPLFEIEGVNYNKEKNIMWFLQRKQFYPQILFKYILEYITRYNKASEEEAIKIKNKLGSIKKTNQIVPVFLNDKHLRQATVEIAIELFKKANKEIIARLQDEEDYRNSESKSLTSDSL